MARYQHTVSDGDSATVPIRDAATVMVVADRPDLHVLMVRRAAKLAFGASAWVFPGGRVDADDATVSSTVVTGLADAEVGGDSGAVVTLLQAVVAASRDQAQPLVFAAIGLDPRQLDLGGVIDRLPIVPLVV